MDNIDIVKKIIKEEINFKARERYHKQKEDGTNKKIKPKEEHIRRGRKPKPKETITKPIKEPIIKQTKEQINKQYDIIMSLVGKADNKYIIDKLKALNRTNKLFKVEDNIKPIEIIEIIPN